MLLGRNSLVIRRQSLSDHIVITKQLWRKTYASASETCSRYRVKTMLLWVGRLLNGTKTREILKQFFRNSVRSGAWCWVKSIVLAVWRLTNDVEVVTNRNNIFVIMNSIFSRTTQIPDRKTAPKPVLLFAFRTISGSVSCPRLFIS